MSIADISGLALYSLLGVHTGLSQTLIPTSPLDSYLSNFAFPGQVLQLVLGHRVNENEKTVTCQDEKSSCTKQLDDTFRALGILIP